MNIMIDLHGVIDTFPEKINSFLKVLKMDPTNKIYICSGNRKCEIEKTLIKLNFICGIHYDTILSLTDYILENFAESEIEYGANNSIWIDDFEWWQLKGKLCKKYNIHMIIDDREEYFIFIPKEIIKLLLK